MFNVFQFPAGKQHCLFIVVVYIHVHVYVHVCMIVVLITVGFLPARTICLRFQGTCTCMYIHVYILQYYIFQLVSA